MRQGNFLTPKAQHTRAALILAARQLAGEKGVDFVTVKAVCALAGVGRTSFYNYFDDVPELLQTIKDEVAGRIKSHFDGLHEDLGRGLARLEKCIAMIFNLACDDRELGLLITQPARAEEPSAQLLRFEITEELKAVREISSAEVEELSYLLTLTTMETARAFATGHLKKSQTARHARYLTRLIVSNA